MAKSPANTAEKTAPTNQHNDNENKKNGKKPKKLLKKILIGLLIIILLAGGFFLGIYLRILDTDKLNKSLHLYDWPIIGSEFVKPDDTEDKTEKVDVGSKEGSSANAAAKTDDKRPQSKPVTLTKKQLEKQKADREAVVNKRVGKLARIYGQMDPKKAADILTPLSDNVVASILQKMDDARSAKVMENFDSARAAQVTQTLYNGVVQPTLPQLDSAETAAASQGGNTVQ